MGAYAPIYHMLHEQTGQTVPWCPVKCKCPEELKKCPNTTEKLLTMTINESTELRTIPYQAPLKQTSHDVA